MILMFDILKFETYYWWDYSEDPVYIPDLCGLCVGECSCWGRKAEKGVYHFKIMTLNVFKRKIQGVIIYNNIIKYLLKHWHIELTVGQSWKEGLGLPATPRKGQRTVTYVRLLDRMCGASAALSFDWLPQSRIMTAPNLSAPEPFKQLCQLNFQVEEKGKLSMAA